MKTDPLQQAIASEKRRRGAPWTYHERDPAKMVENVKRMVALREAIREEFPRMPEPVLNHCLKRTGSKGGALWSGLKPGSVTTRLIVVEFAISIEKTSVADAMNLVKRWSKKGSKCTHQ